MLTINRPLEQKQIAIALGEIAVVSEKQALRSQLGDLLVARGRLTEEQLAEALKVQRESQQRARLGELLVKVGMIKPDDIAVCLKFQIEEEIFDLFTWKGATFEFDSEISIDEACVDELGQFHLQRMAIDPQALIQEASRRMTDWKLIEARLPTPYLCFKLSPKGEELAPKANQPTQQLVKLIKEGRTLETIVKHSHVGRFNICRAMIKLLDEGWVFPYPAAELPLLAAEHRAHRRFSDALFIYRRLLDAAAGDLERRELQSLINDTLQSIRKAQEAGELVEGVEIVSYKEAAARYRFRQTMKRVAGLAFLGLALIAATYALSTLYRPPPRLADDYQDAMKAANEAVKTHKYEEAARIMKAFLQKIPNENCFTYRLVLEFLKSLPIQENKHIEKQLSEARELEKQRRLDDAENKYNELKQFYGRSAYADEFEDGIKRVAAARKAQTEQQDLADLRARLDKAQGLLLQKKYTTARKALQLLADITAALSPEHKEAEDGLAKLKDIQMQVEQDVAAAQALLRAQKGEEAIAAFDKAAMGWPDLAISEDARQQSRHLLAKLEQLGQELRNAETAAAQGGLLDTLGSLHRLSRNYSEFEKRKEVDRLAEEFQAKVNALDARIKQAQEVHRQNRERGRQIYAELLIEQLPFLTERKAQVPVLITSLPSGATVKIDGQAQGATPLDAMVTAGKPFTITWEKQGYDHVEQQVKRLAPENLLVIRASLNREARKLDLKSAILAPPVVLGGQLYVLHGTALSALDLAGKEMWSKTGLLDDTVQSRPNPDGAGPPQLVEDRSWWYPRTAPELWGGKLVLPLRSREVVEIDIQNRGLRKLVSDLPVEPVGRVHLEQDRQLSGKTVLAVGCADGKVRAYDLAQPAVVLWEKPADPANPAPKGALATGLASRKNGAFLALSASGRLTSFKTLNGQEELVLELKSQLAPANSPPGSPQEDLAALVLADGGVTVVDVARHEKVWELSTAQGFDAATHAVVAGDGIYVISRDGVLRKFSRDKQTGKPALLWNRPLDGGTEVPLALGKNVYAVSRAGTLYAVAPNDGHELWKYRVEGTATFMVEHDNLLYAATKEGRLLIMATE